jgi:hypothetical protein
MMERDLSAIVTARPGAYFAIDTDSAGNNGAAVRQIEALVAAKNQPIGSPTPAPGDVCAVRYYCLWDSTAHTYTLKRFFRDSKSTAQTFYNLYTGPNKYADLTNLYKTPGTADEPLAAYAWSLRVTAYDSSDNIINYTTDIAGYQTTNAPYVCDPSASTINPLPAAIEISFKAMSPAAARTVIAATANQSTAYNVWMAGDNSTAASKSDLDLYKQLIEPNTYVFRTRIALH